MASDRSHPAEAVLAELPRIGPRTVVWLDESQFYLDSELGERIASGLVHITGHSDRLAGSQARWAAPARPGR